MPTKQKPLMPEKYTRCDVLQDNLLEALKTVAPFAAKKSTLPVLSHINLAADQGRLAVCATNLESYAVRYIGAMTDEEFALAMPAKSFVEVVGMLNGMIHLSVNHRIAKMTVSSQIMTEKKGKKAIKQENTMLGIDSAEFPCLPYCTTTIAKFSGADLKRVIEHCLFAAAIGDTSRPVLNALCFTVKESAITVAAADGFRLSVDTLLATDTRPGTYLMPSALFKTLASLVKDDEIVTMRASVKPVKRTINGVETTIEEPHSVEFATDSLVIGGQIVDGKYPAYMEIIPENAPIAATVKRKDMLAAIKAALVFLKNGEFKGGVLTINADQRNTMTIESHSPELGESRCEVDASPFIGYDLHMGFNLKYLQEGLLACREALATIYFQVMDTKRELPLKIVENDFIHVIMPMHLDGQAYAHLEKPQENVTEAETGE